MWKIGLATGVMMLAAGVAGQPGMFWGTAVLGALLAAGFWARQRLWVTIPTLHVGVVTQPKTGAFVRFLPAGVQRLRPFGEMVSGLIPQHPGTATAVCTDALTRDGIGVTVHWSLSYTLNPFQIKPGAQPKLSQTLQTSADGVARRHTNHLLRHLVGEMTVEALVGGASPQLERRLRQQLTARLHELGFNISRVMVERIDLPPQVQATLAEAQALDRLQQVIGRFSDADMQRLLELARIQKLGENGVALLLGETAVVPTPAPTTNGKRPRRAWNTSLSANAV